MSAIEDRERAILIDLSRATSSADAVKQLEARLTASQNLRNPGALVDINTGDLLLSPGVLNKMKTVIRHYGGDVETLYSAIPQTQQSALDEGFFVRRNLPSASRFFDPFMSELHKDLDLPFDTGKAPTIPIAESITAPEPFTRLSMTLDDGTVETLDTPLDAAMETLYYRQTLRSGQVLEASGNIVVVGDAHSGSEILADGDILVWGVLGGVAHAGRKGSHKAEIRAIRIEAVQLRIGNCIARRPDRLFKQDNAKRRGPEAAKVKNGEIQIFEDMMER